MPADVEKDQRINNLRLLWAAGILYAEKNPPLSKHFISKFHGLSSSGTRIDDQLASSLYCPHCFNLLRPGNHYARVSPKYHITNVAKLERQTRKHGFWRGNTRRRSQLKRWQNSKTKLLVHCNDCHKLAKIPGSKRRTVQDQPLGFRKLAHQTRLVNTLEQEKAKTTTTTPSVSNETLESRCRSGSNISTQKVTRTPQRKTPKLSTPRHSKPLFNINATPTGTPTSARKARSLQKKGKHQQLQMMLAGAKQEKANAQSKLNDFLVSL